MNKCPLPSCPITTEYCSKHDFIHGSEASELREGIERIIDHTSDESCEDVERVIRKLVSLLEKVDARDSLGYEEAIG